MGAPGFDDSPIRSVPIGKAKPITFIYPYYENPTFLLQQVQKWNEYTPTLKSLLRVIIVDDGSPRVPAANMLRDQRLDFSLRLFRIEVDVRWNWLAARNIGMKHAEDGWCLLTDMDHVVTPALAHALMLGAHDPTVVYRLSRREHTGVVIHPHPNTMFMLRKMFWTLGGYDEALSGHYGTDGDWRRRIAAGADVALLTDYITRFEYVGDSSTIHYKRKQPEDAGKKAIIAARGKGWKPKTLSFPYHEAPLCSM